MMLPNSIEAEKAILGSLILNNDLIYEAINKLTEKDFYNFSNKMIFENIIKLYKQNSAIDPVCLLECIQKDDKASKSIDLVVINDLLNYVATSNHYSHYIDIVKEKSKLRNLIILSKQVGEDCFNNQSYEDIVFKISNAIQDNNEMIDVFSSIELKYLSLKNMQDKLDGKIKGFKTGVVPLDRIFDGYSQGSLNVIAANTGQGKTTLAINIANNAIRSNKNVLIFSLEMDAVDIVNKMISNDINIPFHKLKNAFIGQKEHNNYIELLEKYSEYSFNICDKGMIDIFKICSMVKAEHSKKKLDLIVIDYLQLIKSSNNTSNKSLQIGEITQSLKALARDLKTHIILISQFSRENTKQNRRPILADLKESSSIEQDADTVMFIHSDDNVNYDIIISKNRNGKCESCPVIFDGAYSIFRSL